MVWKHFSCYLTPAFKYFLTNFEMFDTINTTEWLWSCRIRNIRDKHFLYIFMPLQIAIAKESSIWNSSHATMSLQEVLNWLARWYNRKMSYVNTYHKAVICQKVLFKSFWWAQRYVSRVYCIWAISVKETITILSLPLKNKNILIYTDYR